VARRRILEEEIPVKICEECLSEYKPQRNRSAWARSRFCSNKCVLDYGREKHIKNLGPPKRKRGGEGKGRARGKDHPHYKHGRYTKENRYKSNQEDMKTFEGKARRKAQKAKSTGKLIEEPCQRCGLTKNIHMHHEDYSKPLDVVWLCAKCHTARHKELNKQTPA